MTPGRLVGIDQTKHWRFMKGGEGMKLVTSEAALPVLSITKAN
jgi:hypothetical protein